MLQAARKQRCLNRLVIRAAGEFSSDSSLRSEGRIIEKLREFNTFSPGPSSLIKTKNRRTGNHFLVRQTDLCQQQKNLPPQQRLRNAFRMHSLMHHCPVSTGRT